MTNKVQLKKLAKESLTPMMNRHGYELVNGFDYLKKGPNEIYYMISSTISYSEHLKLFVGCYIDEMEELTSLAFPKHLPEMFGGGLTDEYPIQPTKWKIWQVGTESEAIESLKQIESSIQKYAFPFFDSIQSKEDLLAFLPRLPAKGPWVPVINKIKSNI